MAEPFMLELPDGLKWVIDPPVDPYGDGYVRAARVEIRADGLMAVTTVELDSRGDRTLAGFFAGLDADWRGWPGKRRWAAPLGHEMAIEAWRDGRYVMIAVTIEQLRKASAKDMWSACVVFTLDAGEQLKPWPKIWRRCWANDRHTAANGPGATLGVTRTDSLPGLRTRMNVGTDAPEVTD